MTRDARPRCILMRVRERMPWGSRGKRPHRRCCVGRIRRVRRCKNMTVTAGVNGRAGRVSQQLVHMNLPCDWKPKARSRIRQRRDVHYRGWLAVCAPNKRPESISWRAVVNSRGRSHCDSQLRRKGGNQGSRQPSFQRRTKEPEKKKRKQQQQRSSRQEQHSRGSGGSGSRRSRILLAMDSVTLFPSTPAGPSVMSPKRLTLPRIHTRNSKTGSWLSFRLSVPGGGASLSLGLLFKFSCSTRGREVDCCGCRKSERGRERLACGERVDGHACGRAYLGERASQSG